MQTLANMTTEVGSMFRRDVRGKYAHAKASFVASSGKLVVGGMEDPHLPITYYLIAYNNFKIKVKEMLFSSMEKVGFSSDDLLYIIGDVLDRGDNAIALIKDIMCRENVIVIRGNHEQMLLPVFNDLVYASTTEVKNILEEELAIQQIGQESTLRDFANLNTKEQNVIINFIENMPLYAEIKVAGQNFILVHAGLPDFSDMPLEYYDENDLLFGPHDYYIKHYNNARVIVGHLPTRFISSESEDKILHLEDTIAIDCGLGFGGQLGAICLETMEEFYVQ